MRRRGLASRLQHGTLHAARQRWPGLQRVRYTTQLTNGASIALARSCGMREAYRWGFVFVPALSVPAFMARAKELRAELAAQTAGRAAADPSASPPRHSRAARGRRWSRSGRCGEAPFEYGFSV